MIPNLDKIKIQTSRSGQILLFPTKPPIKPIPHQHDIVWHLHWAWSKQHESTKVYHKEKKPLNRIGKLIWGEEFQGIYDLHILSTLGAKILSLVNIKNQLHRKEKGIISFVALSEWILQLSKFIFPILFNQMHYMNISKHKCMHYLQMKKFEINCIV